MVIARITEPLPKQKNCWKGHQYALDVLSGKIIANVYVKGACARYLRDLETQVDFFMDWRKAEEYLFLAQKFEHAIGHWKTKEIVFEPWQCFCFMNIFGFRNRETQFRRFRVAHLEVARGNGKSPMASIAGLFCLSLDNPNGNQVSTVASKKDQARIVLDSARTMAKKSKSFLNATKTKVLAHTITHPESNSIMRALSGEYGGLDGLNDVLAVCDELHAMDRKVFEVITSGMSKRKDSLTLCITTAGDDLASVGHSQSTFAKKVCLNEVQDDSFFAIVYTLDEGDDYENENLWVKANPNIDVSVDRDSLRSKINKAKTTPADIPNIQIKHMNMWIGEAKAFFDLQAWDRCADPTLKLENYLKKNCRVALDLAQHIDLTSLAFVFEEIIDKEKHYFIFDKTYYPEDSVKREKNDIFGAAIKSGHLIETKGAVISYNYIEDELKKAAGDFRIIDCFYDPWSTAGIAQNLADKIEMIKFPQNTGNFSEPMKELDSLAKQGRIHHNGSPLLRWCLGNVVAKEDANSNVFPRKSHVRLKIDPIIAIIMALAGYVADKSGSERSVYEDRGIRSL